MAKLFDKLKEKSQEVAKAAKEKGLEIAQAAKEKQDAKYRSSKEIEGDILLIPCIAKQIIEDFKADGYETDCKQNGEYYELLLSNGGFVKAAAGFKTALKVNIYPEDGNIHIDADIDYATLFEGPVPSFPTWGTVKQSKLDDKAVAIAEKVVATEKIVTLLDGTRIPKSEVPYNGIYFNETGQKVRKVLKLKTKSWEDIHIIISKIATTATDKVSDAAPKRITVQTVLMKVRQTYQFVSDKTMTAVQVVGDKFAELKDDEQVIAAWQKTGEIAGKVGQTSLKGLKIISGVQAVHDRKKSIQTKEEADKLQEEVMATNEDVREDLNDTLETFGRRRMEALHNTVGVFLDYLERLNQKSRTKEYEFLTEIDITSEEIAEMKQIDMKVSDVAKVLTVGGGFAAIGLSISEAAVDSCIIAFLSTGVAPASLTLAASGALIPGLAIISIGTLASSFYSRKYTEATQYLSDVKEWVAQAEASWLVIAGIKQRVLELQGLTTDLETRTVAQLHKLDPYIDNFNNTDMTQVGLFQQAAIMVKSMSELAQVPVLDDDGNLNEQANIVAAKTEKILNTSL